MGRGKLILTSQGLTTVIGRQLIAEELNGIDLTDKKIFLFHEPHFSIERILREVCVWLGFQQRNIFFAGDKISDEELASMDYIYVTEGNTFEVLELMQMRRVMEPMRTAVMNGATYIGASAGAIIAGTDIALAADFDRNFVRLQNLEGLKLFDGTIIPHYTKEELAQYIKNSDEEVISRYHVIYSVANGAKKIL